MKGKLSFGLDEEGEEEKAELTVSGVDTPRSITPDGLGSSKASPAPEDAEVMTKKRLGPNANVRMAPKAMTKSALLREAQTREQLRKEFLVLQEAVKATEIVIPFVFYDGTNIPGGMCKVKKGDYIWVFLDRSRKVGAELGVGSAGEKANRREWARVGVDDLMLVRGEVIIPHVSVWLCDRGYLHTGQLTSFVALRILLLHRQQNARFQQHPPIQLFCATRRHLSLSHLIPIACRPLNLRSPFSSFPVSSQKVQQWTSHSLRLSPRRLPRRSEHNKGRRQTLVRTEQTHLPRERVGGVRSNQGL